LAASEEKKRMNADDIRFNAMRNAIYHSSRRRFFELLSRSLSFLVVVSGTVAVANLQMISPRLMAAIAAIIGALQLVFDFGGRARLHEKLQSQYFQLISTIDGTINPAEVDLAKWESALSLIYADEPPPMRALDAVAYNKACDSLGFGTQARLKIKWWQSLLRQVYSFPNARFAPS
jgi:hypothetical protein